MGDETVHIQYIGKQPMQRDTINGTGIEWDCPGAVQPYPAALKHKLLVHKDVFRQVDPNVVKREVDFAKEVVAYVRGELAGLPESAVKEIAEVVANELRLRVQTPTAPVEVPETAAGLPDEEIAAKLADQAMMEASVARQEKLLAVIRQISPDDDSARTKNGLLRVSVVAERSGIPDVTAAEIAGIVEAAKL